MRFVTTSLAIAVAAMMLTACTGKSSSDQSDQSAAQATAATDSMASPGASDNGMASAEPSAEASSTAAASSAMAGANDVPAYPGATTQAAGTSNMGGTGAAAGKVMSTSDSFDTVYKWYQQHLPAGSEKTHVTAPVESAVFTLGSGTNQTSVTISTVAGKTMITIGSVKTTQ